MNSTITLPRSVVEQALDALKIGHESARDCAETFHIEMSGYKQQRHEALDAEVKQISDAIGVLRAALEQPQVNSPEIPEGWKLVPVEPTRDMKAAGAFAAMDQVRRSYNPPGAYIPVDSMALLSYRAMIAAAPQPPVVEQPQGEQEPVAWIENIGGGVCYNPYHEAARKLPDGVRFDLYASPQPQREPLTEADLYDIAGNYFADEWAQKRAVMMLKDHGIGGAA